MELIDIHAHLNFPSYAPDQGGVIARTVAGGCGVINVGTDLATSAKVVTLTRHPNFWATVGIHPDEVDKLLDDEAWSELVKLANHERAVGIGECGLDYFRVPSELLASAKIKQQALFEKQIRLAKEVNKPLMLHLRSGSVLDANAYNDALNLLKQYQPISGNAHFFAGSVEQAKQFLALGFTLSFTGVITFTTDYDELIKVIPQNQLLAETDSPFVSPAPYRGERNEPLRVAEVVKRLAVIRGGNEVELCQALVANAVRLFKLHLQ